MPVADRTITVRRAETARELVAACDVVCTCVPGPVEMEAVYLGPEGVRAGLRPGALCVDHTTNAPDVVARVGAVLEAVGARLLDAPVDGGREGALAGVLNLFVGGGRRNLERARPVLEPFARAIVPVGTLGSCKIRIAGSAPSAQVR